MLISGKGLAERRARRSAQPPARGWHLPSGIHFTQNQNLHLGLVSGQKMRGNPLLKLTPSREAEAGARAIQPHPL